MPITVLILLSLSSKQDVICEISQGTKLGQVHWNSLLYMTSATLNLFLKK